MSKFQDFYAKVLADEGAKKEISSILAGKALEAASDEQLEKIGGLAKRLGFEITVAEAREFMKKGDKKLSEDDLDAVAGGGLFDKDTSKSPAGGKVIRTDTGTCWQNIGVINLDIQH